MNAGHAVHTILKAMRLGRDEEPRIRYASLTCIVTGVLVVLLCTRVFYTNASTSHSQSQPQKKPTSPRKPVRRYLLVEAAGQGNLPLVKALLAQGADINVQYPNTGFTPLIKAVYERRYPGKDFMRPFAAKHERLTQVINYLLEKGANVNIKTPRGTTALWYAIYNHDYKTTVALLRKGADVNVNVKDKVMEGYTPLYLAAHWADKWLVKALLDRGANVNVATEYGDTPLLIAIMTGYRQNAWLILNRGAKVNVRDKRYGYTPLIAATWGASKEFVKALVARGANINAQDNKGYTALMYAAGIANFNTVQTLIALGADIDIRNKAGQTALQVAVEEAKGAPSARFWRIAYPWTIRALRQAAAKKRKKQTTK